MIKKHSFENDAVKLDYHKFGQGEKQMLCFHGYGMHGEQFKLLEPALGAKYTFWGFDLFFHKQTQLKDQSLKAVKIGITKKQLASLIAEFCSYEQIDRFSVIGYSMGSHYATVVVEELAHRIDEYIIAAPSSIAPGKLINYFSLNKTGNKILEKLVLSEKSLIRIINFLKTVKVVDEGSRDILLKEINTPELRFKLYACFTYLRLLGTDEMHLINMIEKYNIKSIFIFGKHDRMYPPVIAEKFFGKLPGADVIVLDEGHEIINENMVTRLVGLL